MKKTLSMLAIGALSASVITSSIVYAKSEPDLFNLIDSIANNGEVGYQEGQDIKIKEFDDISMTIESPVITNDLGLVMTKYFVQYGTEPVLTLIEKGEIDKIKSKEFKFDNNIANSITMKLMANEDFDPTQNYYVSVVPHDNEDFPGKVSNEIQFNLAQMIGEATAANPQASHPGGTANQGTPVQQAVNTPTPINGGDLDLCAANISYTQNGQSVTVTRTAISNRDIKLGLRHTTQRDFAGLTRVNMTKEAYTFVAARDGTHFMKFESLDANGNVIGNECIQTMHLRPFETINIPVSPESGPEHTTVFFFIALSLFGYMAIRKKSLHKQA